MQLLFYYLIKVIFLPFYILILIVSFQNLIILFYSLIINIYYLIFQEVLKNINFQNINIKLLFVKFTIILLILNFLFILIPYYLLVNKLYLKQFTFYFTYRSLISIYFLIF